MQDLIILEFAEIDIIQTNNFYNSQSQILGQKFRKALDNTFNNILQSPTFYPVEFKSVRKLVMEIFPFNIFYIFEENFIYILAVFHQKRNPKILSKRISKK